MLELTINNRYYAPQFVLTDPAGKLLQYTIILTGGQFTEKGLNIYLEDFEDEPFHMDIFLDMNLNLPIVSPSLLETLNSYNCELGQAIPVLNTFYAGYSVLNLPEFDLIDMDESQASIIQMGNISMLMYKGEQKKPVFKNDKGGQALFRIKHQFKSTYCTDDTARLLQSFDCRAIAIKPVN